MAGPSNSKWRRWSYKTDYLLKKDNLSVTFQKIRWCMMISNKKLTFESYYLSYLHSDGFCRPIPKDPYIFVWCPDENV